MPAVCKRSFITLGRNFQIRTLKLCCRNYYSLGTFYKVINFCVTSPWSWRRYSFLTQLYNIQPIYISSPNETARGSLGLPQSTNYTIALYSPVRAIGCHTLYAKDSCRGEVPGNARLESRPVYYILWTWFFVVFFSPSRNSVRKYID